MGRLSGQFTECAKNCTISGMHFTAGHWHEIEDHDDPVTWVDLWISGNVVHITTSQLQHFYGHRSAAPTAGATVHISKNNKPQKKKQPVAKASPVFTPQCTFCIGDWVKLQPGCTQYKLNTTTNYKVLDTESVGDCILLSNDEGAETWYGAMDFALIGSAPVSSTEQAAAAMARTSRAKFGMGDMAQLDPIYNPPHGLPINNYDKFEVIGVDVSKEMIQIVVNLMPYWVCWKEFMNIGHRTHYDYKKHLPNQDEPAPQNTAGMEILCTTRFGLSLTFGKYYEIEDTNASYAKIKVKNDNGVSSWHSEMSFSLESIKWPDEKWED